MQNYTYKPLKKNVTLTTFKTNSSVLLASFFIQKTYVTKSTDPNYPPT